MTIEEFKVDIINRYQSLVLQELTNYLDSQRIFFSEYEVRVIDFEFNPDHEGELIINFLVTGEDDWEEKAKKDSDYYTTDWKFYLFNIDISPSEMLDEALGFDLGPYIHDISYEELHRFYGELFLVLSNVVKTDSIMSVIKKYNLSDDFRVQFIDSRDDKDYFE
ncbi:hypothetical protein KCN56_08800 [Photobacterium galatheae]|uniref:hypothetical protein n=1 Tax=Photobacterium galatheae TaxID=1654360 RepID=UPI00202CF4E9|nr:hypothetical protein [Photobacterium galatheae]MCM0148655.1 hypothetical protein [Photobacterium galatheae]